MERIESGPVVSPALDGDPTSAQIKSLEERVAALTAANRELLELQERHGASISHLAHELRTPLTSILGFAEILLSQEELTDVQHNFVRRIQNSAHQLQNSLNQLSTLYRAPKVSGDGKSSK